MSTTPEHLRQELAALTDPGPGYWELTVTDPGLTESVPVPRCPSVDEKNGRGLWVIDDLTLGNWNTGRSPAGDRIVRDFLPR